MAFFHIASLSKHLRNNGKYFTTWLHNTPEWMDQSYFDIHICFQIVELLQLLITLTKQFDLAY